MFNNSFCTVFDRRSTATLCHPGLYWHQTTWRHGRGNSNRAMMTPVMISGRIFSVFDFQTPTGAPYLDLARFSVVAFTP